ncbi:MAG: prolyl oligopeptidase family serine peptidase [Canibacter sp.]
MIPVTQRPSRSLATETSTDGFEPEALLAQLRTESQLTREAFVSVIDTAEQLYQRMKERTADRPVPRPIRRGEWWYLTTRDSSRGRISYLRAPVQDPDDWTPPARDDRADDLSLYLPIAVPNVPIAHLEPTSDGRFLLIVSPRRVGHAVLLVEIITGIVRTIVEEGVISVTIAASAAKLYYTTASPGGRSSAQVWEHDLNANLADRLIYEEPDSDFWVTVRASRNERHLIVTSAARNSSEVWHGSLQGDSPVSLQLLSSRHPGRRCSAEHLLLSGEDAFLILLEDERSGRREVRITTDVDDPSGSLFLEDSAVSIQSIHAFERGVLISYRRDGLPRTSLISLEQVESMIRCLSLSDRIASLVEAEVQTRGELTIARPGSNPDWSQPFALVVFESFCGAPETWAVPFDSSAEAHRLDGGATTAENGYREERTTALADDGTSIPISLMWSETSGRSGSARPTVLFVYGAYGVPLDPEYSIPRLSLLDAGFLVAIAHIRGGGELGPAWHRAGSGTNKHVGISDFRDCARHLVASGRTLPGSLVIHGRSAGGTIVASAVNEWPELFTAVIAQDPFVDPLTTLRNTNDSLSRAEWREWGNPTIDSDALSAIAAYSPVQNVRPQIYPPVLAHVAETDSVVSPLESLSWITALRESGAEAWLLADEGRAHAQAGSMESALEHAAFDYAWACSAVGLNGNPDGS